MFSMPHCAIRFGTIRIGKLIPRMTYEYLVKLHLNGFIII